MYDKVLNGLAFIQQHFSGLLTNQRAVQHMPHLQIHLLVTKAAFQLADLLIRTDTALSIQSPQYHVLCSAIHTHINKPIEHSLGTIIAQLSCLKMLRYTSEAGDQTTDP